MVHRIEDALVKKAYGMAVEGRSNSSRLKFRWTDK